MSSLRTLFRTIVVLSPLLVAIGFAYQHFAQGHLSEDWRNILAWNGDGGWPSSDFGEHLHWASAAGWAILLIILVLAGVAIQIGLLLFRRWARTAYLVSTAVIVVMLPFVGLSIHLPLEAAIYEVVSIADGVILALAYFSPLRREFAKSRTGSRYG